MSARRGWVLALERHRRAVARELHEHVACVANSPRFDDFTFDVHAAREHAKTLVAMKRHEGVEVVVDDWRRGLGRPTNTRIPHVRLTSGPAPELPPELPNNAMNWRSLARLGQRILDMLEGQASECQTCHGWGRPSIEARQQQAREHQRRGPRPEIDDLLRPCGDCHGTGHNLRGKLPEVEWSPAVRRKAREATKDSHTRTPQPWTGIAFDAARDHGWELTRVDPETGEIVRDRRTRVCPRGEHISMGHNPETAPDLCRGWAPLDWHDGDADLACPAWRRGEIEHARQRREREARRGILEVDTRRIRVGGSRFGGIMVNEPMPILRFEE